ncbi:MAG: hypothetical protein LWX01_04625 [Deltaproteobacteria bacterium]|nr:hypothetical protein [Deltaproteobacteria bacterium]MDL1960973.1 hypothetical protein [Deltaproteobacteria bacterium]
MILSKSTRKVNKRGRGMKRNDKVVIYHDPITKKRPEGEAILLNRLVQQFDQEYWAVRFMNGWVSSRWIKKKGD